MYYFFSGPDAVSPLALSRCSGLHSRRTGVGGLDHASECFGTGGGGLRIGKSEEIGGGNPFLWAFYHQGHESRIGSHARFAEFFR